MAARDEGLVDADGHVVVPAHLEGVALQGELHRGAARAFPDESRQSAHCPARRAARAETAGPSLSTRVASFASAAAR